MRTTISKWSNGCWLWCGDSMSTATRADPFRDCTADLGGAVWAALDEAAEEHEDDDCAEYEVSVGEDRYLVTYRE